MNAIAPKSYPQWAPWRVAALSIAIAAGLVAMIALAVMSHSFYERKVNTPLDHTRIADLRQTHHERLDAGELDAADEISTTIRQLDLELREAFFVHQQRMRIGAWLMLISVAVCLGAVKLWRKLGQRAPMPPQIPPGARPIERITREMATARWAVAAVGLLIAGLCGGWITAHLPPGVDQAKVEVAVDPARQWSRFHGPTGDGVIPGQSNPPVYWDGKAGKNIAWIAPLPLPGHSSPVVWGDRIFVSAADKPAQKLMCLSLGDGQMLWDASIGKPPAARNVTAYDENVYAAPTPIVDADRVYALFASGDVAAFTHDGEPVWSVELGVPVNAYGHASSPVLVDGLVVVQFDGERVHDLIALDAATGQQKWRTPREVKASWATPTVIDAPTGKQIVTISIDGVVSVDAAGGKVLWQVKGIGGDADGAVASAPILVGGHVIALDPYMNELIAINPDPAAADDQRIVWKQEYEPEIASLATPVTDGRRLYLIGAYGFVCVDAATGKVVWSHEPEGDQAYSAGMNSSLLAGGRWYVPDGQGAMWILKAGEAYELIEKSPLGEVFTSTPALAGAAGDRLLIRTPKKLYCIAAGRPQAVTP